jgi:hypothetical protein
VAATSGAAHPASAAKQKTSRGRSNARAPAAKRPTSQAPITASSVLPIAIPAELSCEPAVVTLTRKAPSRIAGHSRSPNSSRPARATPAAGQIAVTLAWTNASFRPSLPATT